jgi:hypothetical protein
VGQLAGGQWPSGPMGGGPVGWWFCGLVGQRPGGPVNGQQQCGGGGPSVLSVHHGLENSSMG